MNTLSNAEVEPATGAKTEEPRTLFELFRQVTTAHADRPAFRVKRDGAWVDITWSEQAGAVESVARGMVALGIDKGGRIAILSGTRLEWVRCDSAAVNIGAVTVGIYHSNPADECSYILEHSESELVFVEDREQLDKVLKIRSQLPQLRHVVIYDGESDPDNGVLSWSDFQERGREVDPARIELMGRSIEPQDLASLVYTSGTTGVPKGAMISHANLVFVSNAASQALYIEPGFSTLLFLPLAHVFARMIVYMCLRASLLIAFAEDMGKIPANLAEVRPQFIASVPRVYEKVREKVMTKVEDCGGLREKLFRWALEVGRQASRLKLAGKPLPPWLALRHAIADRLALRKVQAAFGGRLVWGVSGAAPLSPEVNEFFHACGVFVIEGIGMTENTSISNVNPMTRNKIGTVGPTVPGVEMKTAEDGEVLYRGPNVMLGYYKNPEATAETIDPDGWLHTGDIGEIDEDGYLRITDRKKDLIITAGGKNVAPQRVEAALRDSRYLSQVVVCGDGRKFLTALVTLDSDNIRQWAAEHGLAGKSSEELGRTPEVQELIEREIHERNADLGSFETVKKFRILPADLSIEAGELTASLKIKRKVVYDKYRPLLEEMYGDG